MEGLEDLLKMLLHKHEDYEGWDQMGVCTKPEMLKARAVEARGKSIMRKIRVLAAKAKALDAEMSAAQKEWWANLYEAHGLPEGRDYHVMDDGRIVSRPVRRKASGGEVGHA